MASEKDRGGTVWDAPNQQVVREDGSAPWEEGTGGQPGEETPEEPGKKASKGEEPKEESKPAPKAKAKE